MAWSHFGIVWQMYETHHHTHTGRGTRTAELWQLIMIFHLNLFDGLISRIWCRFQQETTITKQQQNRMCV
jgi:hypothetical protein